MEILSYRDCVRLIAKGRNGKKKLAGNTYLEEDPRGYLIRLYKTAIIGYSADGTVTVGYGGYRTVTTKARLNAYSPIKVSQRKFDWYINGDIPFDSVKTFLPFTWVFGDEDQPFLEAMKAVLHHYDRLTAARSIYRDWLSEQADLDKRVRADKLDRIIKGY